MCVLKLYRAQNQCVRSVTHTSTADRIAYRFLMYYQMLCDESTTNKNGRQSQGIDHSIDNDLHHFDVIDMINRSKDP